jgi:ataxia telangiectasia mutated family protein
LLSKDLEKGQALRNELSAAFRVYLADDNDALLSKQRYLMQLLLYLRSQVFPGENTHADRLRWLEVDWLLAAQVADRCQLPHTALLFAESIQQPSHGGRRASSRTSLSQIPIDDIPRDLLLSIFKTIEEPDSFYGVEQQASLGSVLDRLDYEADGYRSLMFRSAQTDADLRRSHRLGSLDGTGMIRSLSMLNLNSLTFALLSGGFGTAQASEELLNSARRLQQWEIMPPESISQAASSSFTVLQDFSRATDRNLMQSRLKSIIFDHSRPMINLNRDEKPHHEWFGTLAALAETAELLSERGHHAIRSAWSRMLNRQSWMKMGQYETFRGILSNRNALFSLLAQNGSISSGFGAGAKECRIVEIESLLNASGLARGHGQLQEAIGATTQLANIINECQEIGLQADVVTKSETASVLWSTGEVTASVHMLRDALAAPTFESQDISAGRPGLLAQLAHQLAEARLEKPEEILAKYLEPAISHLQKRSEGEEAGKVYHEFATFCDKQLQNPANIDELNRITKLRQSKFEEMEELKGLSKAAKTSHGERNEYAKDLRRATQWFEMDDADYKRLMQSRDTFMQQSLQNYLLALRASDNHDISVLRFFALWLENAEIAPANAVVSKYLPQVPSWKFVVLMNQLMSRLEHDNSGFQSSLKSLATRICSEHPHHSLHHLFATTRIPSGKDLAAKSRYEVAQSIRKHVSAQPKKGEQLNNIFSANKYYNEVAVDKAEEKKGSRISVKDLRTAFAMYSKVPGCHVPPPTINIPLNREGDYGDVPVVTKFGSDVRFMSGLSRPKRVTALASDGQHYVLLLKSGDDDLRQDAIMEQVFDEASKMLRNHKTARQRNLHIRTYKVIPLSHRSGIIEFVPNSTSFSDFLVSAHERYYPQDCKYNVARSKISGFQDHSPDTRLKEYRKICDHLQPAMRHFFFERYTDPDDWFEKRTAYTRTTAAVSILGHVLGLGDRHCQNIMLDEKTGEVVHIDLGVAFEAGKVLPVPEKVPFRLTRDVVDGMGITKTEGVFRRCCEFTLDALREDKDSIMTLLNVLRYDPLYTWTVSPVRAKRMQLEMGRNANDAGVPEGSSKKREQEAGEADRALSTVEKKLSQTLSTAATVNELIREATDERRLATLFSGWSAFF